MFLFSVSSLRKKNNQSPGYYSRFSVHSTIMCQKKILKSFLIILAVMILSKLKNSHAIALIDIYIQKRGKYPTYFFIASCALKRITHCDMGFVLSKVLSSLTFN